VLANGSMSSSQNNEVQIRGPSSFRVESNTDNSWS